MEQGQKEEGPRRRLGSLNEKVGQDSPVEAMVQVIWVSSEQVGDAVVNEESQENNTTTNNETGDGIMVFDLTVLHSVLLPKFSEFVLWEVWVLTFYRTCKIYDAFIPSLRII